MKEVQQFTIELCEAGTLPEPVFSGNRKAVTGWLAEWLKEPLGLTVAIRPVAKDAPELVASR